MARFRIGFRLLATLTLLGGLTQAGLGAVTVDQVLAYKPKQPGVEVATPAAADVATCTIELEKGAKVAGDKQATAWVVKDAKGNVLRKFHDTTIRMSFSAATAMWRASFSASSGMAPAATYAWASAIVSAVSSRTLRGVRANSSPIFFRIGSAARSISKSTSVETNPSHRSALSSSRRRRVTTIRSSGPGSVNAPRTDVSR